MADLGNRAEHLCAFKPTQGEWQFQSRALFIKSIVGGRTVWVGGVRMNSAQQSTSDGFSAQPCLEWNQGGLHRFRWTVQAGARSVSIYVKNVGGLTPYPTMRIIANPTIGVNADVVATAVAGTGWQQLTATCNPSSVGALWVEIRADQNSNNPRVVRWDQFSTS